MKRCCNSCGFLLTNKDAESPAGQHWYTDENIERLWHDGLKYGKLLVCHSTDPNADNYGGVKKSNKGAETACLGALTPVYMHVKIFEFLQSYKEYRNAVGHKVAMTKEGIMESCISLLLGRTGIFYGMTVPSSSEDDREIRVPAGFERTKKLYDQIITKSDGVIV